MKSVRLVLMLAAAVTIAVAPSYAFHMGGVAECGGCHSMHSSPQGAGGSLLVNSDKSSTCLSCHEGTPGSYHISTPDSAQGPGNPPDQLTPGGDFGWLKKTYTYVLRGNTITEEGERHGHNILAADFGYVDVDVQNPTSPGGDYPATGMSCVSCHDPHGKSRRLADGSVVNPAVGTSSLPIASSGSYQNSADPTAAFAVGVYRLLGGPGYTDNLGAAFPGAPAAVVNSTYNRTEASTITRAAYGNVSGSGHVTWGLWCGNCHAAMNNGMSLAGGAVHPIDEELGDLANLYNAYRGSGNMGGTAPTAYSSLVPFVESPAGATPAFYDTLQSHATINGTAMNGPVTGDQVSCLSCHRAHASGWVEAVRWNMEGELILVAGQWPGSDAPTVTGAASQPNDVKWAQGRTQEETKAAYNYYPESRFAAYQRVLCNKCHAKD